MSGELSGLNIRDLAIKLAEEIDKLENECRNKNNVEAEAKTGNVKTGEVESEVDSEVDDEQKMSIHVYNGNSTIKNSGNAKSSAKQKVKFEDD